MVKGRSLEERLETGLSGEDTIRGEAGLKRGWGRNKGEIRARVGQ